MVGETRWFIPNVGSRNREASGQERLPHRHDIHSAVLERYRGDDERQRYLLLEGQHAHKHRLFLESGSLSVRVLQDVDHRLPLDRHWDRLSITRYGFTSFGHRNTRTLDRWRERTVRFTTTVTVMYLSSVVFYIAGSLAFREDVIPVKNHDGSVDNYHQNVMNFYFFGSNLTYNAHYNTFFFVDTVTVILLSMLFLISDVLLVTLCFATCCQMQMVSCAFESFGHDKSLGDDPRRSHHRSPIGEYDCSGMCMCILNYCTTNSDT